MAPLFHTFNMKRARPVDFDISDITALGEAKAKVARINGALFKHWETHDWFMWISGAAANGIFEDATDMDTRLRMAQYAALFEDGEFGIPTDRYGQDIINDANCERHVWKAWHLNTLSTTDNQFY
nr:hypothetical protein [Crucivirus sp.]